MAKLFRIADEYQLLQQQATRRKIGSCLRRLRMHPSDFFQSCDVDQDGFLTADADT